MSIEVLQFYCHATLETKFTCRLELFNYYHIQIESCRISLILRNSQFIQGHSRCDRLIRSGVKDSWICGITMPSCMWVKIRKKVCSCNRALLLQWKLINSLYMRINVIVTLVCNTHLQYPIIFLFEVLSKSKLSPYSCLCLLNNFNKKYIWSIISHFRNKYGFMVRGLIWSSVISVRVM